MDFYMNPVSTNCRKVDAVIKQLGLSVNYKIIDLPKGEHRSAAYLAINPNGKVPTLVDGDMRLWESNAIQCYVASKVETSLWPKSNLRYDVLRWQAWELAHFGAAARQLFFERVLKPTLGFGQTNEARCAEEEENFRRSAAVLDGHLRGRRFVVGDTVTLADFCLAASLTYAEPARVPLAEFKEVQRWFRELDEQPGWRASAPPPM